MAVWVPDKEISYINLTEGRLELLIINVYLFCILHCVSYISQHISWEIGVNSELNPNGLYVATIAKEHPFTFR
jgi:hypothetical protein